MAALSEDWEAGAPKDHLSRPMTPLTKIIFNQHNFVDQEHQSTAPE